MNKQFKPAQATNYKEEMPMTMTEKLLSANEAAELAGLHPATLRKMAWQRRIRSYKVLGCLRFRQSDLEELIVERPARSSDLKKGGNRE